MTELDYTWINDALQRVSIAADAAECHGALSACLAVLGKGGEQAWLQHTIPELHRAIGEGDALALEAQQIMHGLFVQTGEHLWANECTYTPLLPSDEQDLAQRITALSHWCQGFLLGLQVSGIDMRQDLSGDLAEIVADFSKMSQVTADHLNYDEEEEQSYAELVEYLRIGVMLFAEEYRTDDGRVGPIH